MELIRISPRDITFPYANNEMGLRPEPKETDKDWQETLNLLADIRVNGMMDLFSVRPLGNGKYEVINGSRRAKVCQMLCEEGHPNFQEIYVQVSSMSEIDSLERQVAGNATVQPTNTKQYAAALAKIALHKGYDINTLANKVGKSVSFVVNMLRFNRLPDTIRDAVATGIMPVTNAIALTKLPAEMDKLAFMQDACALDTTAFAAKLNEEIEKYKEEVRAVRAGKSVEFVLTEKKIKEEEIKAKLVYAQNLVNDDPSDFNRGYLRALEEIFQIDEASAARRRAEWEKDQQEKQAAIEKRKAENIEKKKKDAAAFLKAQGVVSLDQITA